MSKVYKKSVGKTNFFINLNISKKIYVSFTGVIILFVAVYFINNIMDNQMRHDTDLLIDTLECISSKKDIQMAISSQKVFQDLALNIGAVGVDSSKYVVNSEIFNEAYNKILTNGKLFTNGELEHLYSIQKLHQEKYDIFFKKILDISGDIKNGVGKNIEVDKERIQIQNLIRNNEKIFNEEILEFTDILKSKNELYNNKLEQNYRTRTTFFIILICVAIILTALLSLILTRVIVNRIKNITIIAKELGEGNLNLSVNESLNGNDEVGELAKKFTYTIGSLKKILLKISTSSETILETSDLVVDNNLKTQDGLKNASSQMEDVVDGADKQQKNIENFYNNTTEIFSNIQEIRESSGVLKDYANQTNNVGVESLSNLKETEEQMININNEAHEMVNLVNNLKERSNSIVAIVDLIEGVSSQTKLLALNTSIEAAKTSQEGNGFTVIANTIRTLSNQVSESTASILEIVKDLKDEVETMNKKINSSTKETEKGIVLISKTSDRFKQITDSVVFQLEITNNLSENINSLSDKFSNIKESMNEIFQTSKEITDVTKGSSSIIDERLSMTYEISSASKELAEVASELKSLIAIFKI